MLTKLHIDNLKCFKEFSLRLAPLTLLTGFNAAGKSTSIQSLLLLAQALRGGPRNWKIPLNGELVQLGTPGDALHDGAAGELVIGIETDKVRLAWSLTAEDRSQSHSMTVSHIQWQSDIDHGIYIRDNELLDGILPRAADKGIKSVTDVIANTIYISAIRSGPDDVYPIPTSPEPIPADVGVRGEYSAWWIERMGEDDIDTKRFHPSEVATIFRRQLNAWAGTLFPGAQVNATRIPNTQFCQLALRNHESDKWRKPSNIGYGLTYALPILVAGLIARPGQILVIDSPEAHLHPMGQSQMGRFLAMVAASGVQVIVETHSDHVLNGMRLAVFEKKLIPEQVAVHFFNSRPREADEHAHVISPRLDIKGNLSEWPGGFFDQAENDLTILAGWGQV